MADPVTGNRRDITDLFVRCSVLGVPIGLCLSHDDASGWWLEGRVSIDRTVGELLGSGQGGHGELPLPDVLGRLDQAAGRTFSQALAALRVSALGLRIGPLAGGAAGGPTRVELAIDLAAAKRRLRIGGLIDVEAPGERWIAGLCLQGEDETGDPNALSGLVGDITIGELGFSYVHGHLPAPALDLRRPFVSEDDFAPADSGPRAASLQPGFHFIGDVRVAGIALLPDSLTAPATSAGSAAAPPAPAPIPAPAPSAVPAPAAAPAPKAGAVAWIKVGKRIGPLAVQRIGLGLEGGSLVIKFDAGVKLGPLTLTLEGLGVGYPLGCLAEGLSAVRSHLQFQLDGAGVAFDGGPVRISGGLRRALPEKPLRLEGCLVISTQALTVSAIASYTTIDGQPSFFVFAALHRELGGPPFCFVTALALGLGLNRRLKLPPIEAVERFPLLRATMDRSYPFPGADTARASEVLPAMSAELDCYVTPSSGDMWLAAGLRFRSFGMVETAALLTVAFGTRTEIGLLGLSRLQVPPKTDQASSGTPIACAELALKVAVVPEDGVLSVEAQLTENSYILRKEFKLRGGFALFWWFGGPKKDDFVISLGGYHPRFIVPVHYPRPQLVSFSSQVDAVVISGSCYFALCPAAIMAGARLSMVYDSGSVRAWFNASADLLLQWKPVHYELSVAVSVGVAVNLKIVFVRVRFSVELGATLTLYGPPLGGAVRISLWVVSFTVRFGSACVAPPALQWDCENAELSFRKAFLPGELLRVAVVDGLKFEDRSKPGDGQGPVVDGHCVVIECSTQVPASGLTLVNCGDGPALPTLPKIGVRPMHLGRLEAPLTVSVRRLDGSGRPEPVMQIAEYLIRAVPTALWAADQAAGAPQVPDPDAMLVRGALVGVRLRVPEPEPEGVPVFKRAAELLPAGPPATPARPCGRAVRPVGYERLPAQQVRERRLQLHALLCALKPQGPRPESLATNDPADAPEAYFHAAPDTALLGQLPPSLGGV